MRRASLYCRFGKRTLDIVASAALLIACAPALLVIAVLVRVVLGSPVLFLQQRPGLRGRPFRLMKFRTMMDARDGTGALRPDADRLTRLGRVLRATSLDELPEFVNVWRGDMSLVGPRPLLMAYLPRYTPEQARRHEVRPGITGWAQVNGRNAVEWPQRFALDLWYVDHVSFALDVKILARTLLHLVRPEGVSHPGHVTMEEFMGDARATFVPGETNPAEGQNGCARGSARRR